MLRPRIIPCLLVHSRGLVKTKKFKDPKYVGDPINAVKIFNEKEVDELIVVDIDASPEKRSPDFKMIENLATECRMPLCYGGGIRTLEDAQRICGLGVEKIALSSAALENPALVSKIAERIGRQSVVVVLDVKKRRLSSTYDVWSYNGTRNSKRCPIELAREFQDRGAGEIVINSIDHDGVMSGYDLEIVDLIRRAISLPMTVMGGAGTLADIEDLIRRFGTIGGAAGSLFVFKGVYRAVLINYPNREDKDALVARATRRP
jgi:cyclase